MAVSLVATGAGSCDRTLLGVDVGEDVTVTAVVAVAVTVTVVAGGATGADALTV